LLGIFLVAVQQKSNICQSFSTTVNFKSAKTEMHTNVTPMQTLLDHDEHGRETLRACSYVSKKTKAMKPIRILATCANKTKFPSELLYTTFYFLSIPHIHQILSVCKLWNLYAIKAILDKHKQAANELLCSFNNSLWFNIPILSIFEPQQQLVEDMDVNRKHHKVEQTLYGNANNYPSNLLSLLEDTRLVPIKDKLKVFIHSVYCLSTTVVHFQIPDSVFVIDNVRYYNGGAYSWIFRMQGGEYVGIECHQGVGFYD
jgi:DNA-binding phage protein